MTLIFRLKRKVPFAAEASVSKELDHLEQISVLIKMDNSEWAKPKVYMKKKNNKLRASAKSWRHIGEIKWWQSIFKNGFV